MQSDRFASANDASYRLLARDHAVWKPLPRIHTKEVMKMKQFVEPTIEYEEFEPVDVLTVSGFGDPELPPDPF